MNERIIGVLHLRQGTGNTQHPTGVAVFCRRIVPELPPYCGNGKNTPAPATVGTRLFDMLILRPAA
jgi:hypothetical protein